VVAQEALQLRAVGGIADGAGQHGHDSFGAVVVDRLAI
jgi:hypothetical protein